VTTGRKRARPARCITALLLLWAALSPALASEQLTLVLNWVPGADHAPFFFALRRGWYAEAGIDLTIDAVAGSPEAVKRAAGDAGTLAVSDFVSYLRVRNGLRETSAVMALQPHSPYAIYFSADSGIRGVQDLARKRIAAQEQDPMRGLWQPLAQRNGVAPGSVTWVERSNPAKPDALAAGEADAAFNPFLHNHLDYAAVLGERMRVLWWHELGFAAYGHVLVASRATIERLPERLRGFVAVTQRAWAQCLADAAPCIDALVAEHPQLERAREEEVWKLVAQLYRTSAPTQRPLGAFDATRVERTLQDFSAAFGVSAGAACATNGAFLDQIRAAP
jgi:NitT/TauT family transport system substrate-binding protein